MTQLLLFNSTLPWRLHSHRQARSRDITSIVLWLHNTAQSLFGEIVGTNEQTDEVARLLVERQAYLLTAAYDLTRNTMVDAHDLVQVTNELVLKNRHTWNRLDFRKWIYTILFRQFLLELENEKKRRGIDLDDDAWERLEDRATSVGADAVVERLEFDQQMMRLSEQHRNVLRLFMNDYTYQEMAEMLDIPVGTVMSRLKRAKRSFNALRNLDQSRDEAQA